MAWSPSSKASLGRSPTGTAMLAASSRKHVARRAGSVKWSRTQAVPADCLCLRNATGLRPMAGPALGPQVRSPESVRDPEEH